MKSIFEWVSRSWITDELWAFALDDPRVTTKAAAMMTAASSTAPLTMNAHPGMPPLLPLLGAMPSPVPSRFARRSFVSCFLALPILSDDSDGRNAGTAPILAGHVDMDARAVRARNRRRGLARHTGNAARARPGPPAPAAPGSGARDRAQGGPQPRDRGWHRASHDRGERDRTRPPRELGQGPPRRRRAEGGDPGGDDRPAGGPRLRARSKRAPGSLRADAHPPFGRHPGRRLADAVMSDPEPRYCPYCGEPLGSFFGNRLADGSRWCERCQESFRVSIVNLDEGSEEAPGETEGAP